MNEIWMPVPGFPRYRVSNLGRFKSVSKTGKEHMISMRNKRVFMHNGGISRSLSIGKAMYSAFNHIELSLLDDVYIIGGTLDSLRLMSMEEFLSGNLRNSRVLKADPLWVERAQRNTYEDMRILIDAWDSGDTTRLAERILSYKEEIVFYACRRFNLSAARAEDYWHEASTALIVSILAKERPVSGFPGWLKITIRNLIGRDRKQSSRQVSYNDNLSHCK